MQKFKYLFYLLAAVLLTGCGQTVIETLHVPDPPDPSAPGVGSTIVILPFADYSSKDVISGAYRRNLTVTEAMTDRLVANGFGIAVQEDIFGYLVDESIISIADYDGASNTSLSSELNSIEWSNEMKSLLHGYLMEETVRTASISVESSPGAHALDQQAIAKIGRKFQADYVVRGRILEYKTRDEASWAPWKKGIIPFVIGGTNRVFNGYASSDAYDQRNEAITGAILGGIIGYNNAGWPWADDKTILGMTDGSANALFWAGAGAGLGVMFLIQVVKLTRLQFNSVSGYRKHLRETLSGPTESGFLYLLKPFSLTSNTIHSLTLPLRKVSTHLSLTL